MSRPNTRERLLDAGLETLHRRGFNGCGVQEIVDAAGVPKGSFYNHFDSKEALGVAVLERYWQLRSETVLRLLQDPDTPPRERLLRYFAALADTMAARRYAGGCLIGNLGAELSDQSPLVCECLATVFAGWRRALAACIEAGQRQGEIRGDLDAPTLAAFLIDAWEGAILRARVEKSGQPFSDFHHIVFDTLLPPNPVRDEP